MKLDALQAYHLLGLRSGATPDEVKSAYRDLAQVWHPDRFATNERLRDKAAHNLQRINEAYAVLRQLQLPLDTVAAVPQAAPFAPLSMGERISAAFGIRYAGHAAVLDRREVLRPSPTYGRRQRRRQRRHAWMLVGALLVVLFGTMVAALIAWVW